MDDILGRIKYQIDRNNNTLDVLDSDDAAADINKELHRELKIMWDIVQDLAMRIKPRMSGHVHTLGTLSPYLQHINGCQYPTTFIPPGGGEARHANCICGLNDLLAAETSVEPYCIRCQSTNVTLCQNSSARWVQCNNERCGGPHHVATHPELAQFFKEWRFGPNV